MLNFQYNKVKYQIEFPLNGEITINSEPFLLKYTIYSKLEQKVSPFELMKRNETSEYTAKSKRPLKEIDGVIVHEIGKIKLEIIKGRIFLMDKSIEDYL